MGWGSLADSHAENLSYLQAELRIHANDSAAVANVKLNKQIDEYVGQLKLFSLRFVANSSCNNIAQSCTVHKFKSAYGLLMYLYFTNVCIDLYIK